MEDGKVRKIEQFTHPAKISGGLRKSKISFRKRCKNFATLRKFCKPKAALRNPKGCVNPFRNPKNPFHKSVRNPKAFVNFNSYLKLYLKASKPCFNFAHPFLITKSSTTLRRPIVHHFSLHWIPCGQPFEEVTYTSRPISDMAHIRGGHTDPSLSCDLRPEPPLLRIRHFRPSRSQPFHLLRVECPITLLSADTRYRDHRLLHP